MPLAQEIAAKQLTVLYLDECHLVWGDAGGDVWGPSDQRITVPIAHQRDRQTSYGALDAYTGEVTVIPMEAGTTEGTLVFVE